MEIKKNSFKEALKSGATQWGLWSGLPDASCVEICAGAGFDWLLLDGEHSPLDVPKVLTQLQAVSAYDTHPVVRPVCGDVNLIKKLLDVGAQTLLVPMVDTAEQAAQLVKAMRYPPEGIRGLGTSLARAAGWGRVTGYLKEANEQMCLLVQVETVTALENLDKIVKVEGVDGVFIGPSDLSASMGYIGNPGHPDVVAAIEKGLATIRAAGKAAGLLAVAPDLARAYAAKGANFVAVGVDTMILARETKHLADSFKSDEPVEKAKLGAGY